MPRFTLWLAVLFYVWCSLGNTSMSYHNSAIGRGFRYSSLSREAKFHYRQFEEGRFRTGDPQNFKS